MMHQEVQNDQPDQLLQQEINDVTNVADMTDEQLMCWIDAQIERLGLHRNPNVSLKEIAKALGLTQRRITQAIKTRREDNTLAEYLNTKRLLDGCRLLVEQPNWTIDAVAHEAGFGGTTTFRTIFRNRFGMSPKQYREKKRLIEGIQEEE
jgi:transcriptional regulator GlxA family with amidase domain